MQWQSTYDLHLSLYRLSHSQLHFHPLPPALSRTWPPLFAELRFTIERGLTTTLVEARTTSTMVAKSSFLVWNLAGSSAFYVRSFKTQPSVATTGLTSGCVHPHPHSPPPDALSQTTYTQCSECGICGTIVTDPCGTCRRAGASCCCRLLHGSGFLTWL